MLKNKQTPKNPENELCLCGSNKKVKKCCFKNLNKDIYSIGQDEKSSDKVYECINKLKIKYPDYNIIDITLKLTDLTYKPYQIANFKSKTIMIAEKIEKNKEVFLTRCDSQLSDIIIMNHGAFKTFSFLNFDRVFNNICLMIK
jgi:uncharacterized protein YcgI (DUF1989 family)